MAKQDLLKQLPSPAEGQKAIRNNVQEIVDAKVRINSEEELISTIKEVAKEKWGVCPTWLALQADIVYDREYNEGKKYQKVLEKAEEVEMNEETFASE